MSDSDGTILSKETLRSPFAEAYRALRANINFSSIDAPVSSVVVTSASAGEGKTTTAVNLGIIMAQSGMRTILVDGDFRRPGLHVALGFGENGSGPKSGLSNVIVGAAQLDQVILETAYPGLRLIPVGAMPPNPSELLGSTRMKAVISELASRADFVIIDTPPCRLYADALILGAEVDGLIFVLRAGNQDKAAQRWVQKQVKQTRARMLGVVFNDAEVDDSVTSYNYYYGRGKKPKHR